MCVVCCVCCVLCCVCVCFDLVVVVVDDVVIVVIDSTSSSFKKINIYIYKWPNGSVSWCNPLLYVSRLKLPSGRPNGRHIGKHVFRLFALILFCFAGTFHCTSLTQRFQWGSKGRYAPKPVLSFFFLPSKHAGSDSHPIRVGSEALAISGPSDSSTPASFQTGSVWPKPDTVSQNQIGSGLVFHNMILGRGQPSLKEGSGPMIRAYRLASRPDAFGQNLTRLDPNT